jgi:hypothetical protein
MYADPDLPEEPDLENRSGNGCDNDHDASPVTDYFFISEEQ